MFPHHDFSLASCNQDLPYHVLAANMTRKENLKLQMAQILGAFIAQKAAHEPCVLPNFLYVD